jgi:polysaccharide pyruvyl transferase WcaK-like protein
MTHKILALGSASGKNVGDVALLRAGFECIRDELPEVVFVVPTDDEEGTLACLNGLPVETVPTGRNRFCSSSVFKAARAVVGAATFGGIFFDQKWTRRRYSFISTITPLLAAVRGRGKPVVGFNVGVLPPTTIPGRLLMRASLKTHDRVFARFREDLRVLEGIGLGSRSEVSADSALLMPPTPRGNVSDSSSPLIGINLTPQLAGNEGAPDREQLTAYFGAVVRSLVGRHSARVSLIATSTPDQPFIDDVVEESGVTVGVDRVRANELNDVLTAVSTCDLFLGTRMHSLLFAVLSGTPFFGIAYREKVRALTRELGGERSRVLEVDWERPDELANALSLDPDVASKETALLREWHATEGDKARNPARWLRDQLI